MFYDGGFYMIGMHALWWIFWLGLLGALVFYLWRRPNAPLHRPRESAHDVLRRRLASGDITPQQYEERKALLDRDAPGQP